MTTRQITYAQAINEALHQIMEADERVILIGQGVTNPWYIGTTTKGLIDRFGPKRVIDTPISENAITGIAAGAALGGLRPILIHPRHDFMWLAMDQIANHIATWDFLYHQKIPIVIWAIVNRGLEQGAQHSQSLHAVFAHIPGLKVVAPFCPAEAKGLLTDAIEDNDPVIFLDDRWLYQEKGEVKRGKYISPFGDIWGWPPRNCSKEKITIISFSALTKIVFKIWEKMDGIEIINPIILKPFPTEMAFDSIKRTGRLVIVDGGWLTCGFAAEIAALVQEYCFEYLKAPIRRVTLPDTPAPASRTLEKSYYPSKEVIIKAIKEVLEYGSDK